MSGASQWPVLGLAHFHIFTFLLVIWTVGLTTWSCMGLKTDQRGGMPSKQILRGLSLCEPHKVQQGQVQCPAPDLAWVQAGQRVDWDYLWGEGLADIHGQKAQHQCAVHSPESQLHPGLHQKQQVWEDDSSPSALLLWDCSWSAASSPGTHKARKTWTTWSECRGASLSWPQVWTHLLYGKGLMCWSCFHPGVGKGLEQPSRT